MKLTAEYKNKTYSKDGKINLMFAVDPKYLALIEGLKNEDYLLEIKKPSNKRTLRQNAYLWSLINEICLTEDGDLSNAEDLYLQLLEKSGAKSTYISIRKDAVEDLRKLVRHMKVLDEIVYKGVLFNTVQIFFGSSTYDSKEMTALIDEILKYASEIGIESEYWRELLK